jgi:aspartate/methionine/tyrosine aminotransferase
MWFRRMSLEEWFDKYQYRVRFDVGESAVKFLKVRDLGLDLSEIDLRYGHHLGRPDLRAEIAKEYDGLSGDHVLVTSGGAEGIFAITAALVRPGDHVIVEHPNYPSTYEVARGLGCEVTLLPLAMEHGFRPDLDRLDSLVTSRTRLLIFTHPNNPTGSMIEPSDLDHLIRFAEAHRIHLLFDETYRHLAFGPSLPAAATLSPWAISLTSMSKCYGLPGIRIGWLATRSREILDGVLAVREQVTITNTALGEAIATAVLARRGEFLERARAHICANFALVAGWMDAQRGYLEWVAPEGGVVALPRLAETVAGDPETLYRSLAEDHEVFVIPGRCFEVDNRFFRLGFGATREELSAGLDRVGAALAAVAGSVAR